MDKIVKRRNNRKKYYILAFIVVISVFIYQAISSKQIIIPTIHKNELSISKVIQEDFLESIHLTGLIIPGITLPIQASEDGKVIKIYSKQGSHLNKDQLIVKLASEDLDTKLLLKKGEIIERLNDLKYAKLKLEQSIAQMKEKRLDLDYKLKDNKIKYNINKKLYELKQLPKAEFEEIKFEYNYLKDKLVYSQNILKYDHLLKEQNCKTIAANIDFIKIEQLSIEKRIKNLSIVSPVVGQLTKLHVTTGENIDTGEMIAQIDITDVFKIRAKVDEYYITRIMNGNKGYINNDDIRYEVYINDISPQVKEGMFEVELVFLSNTPKNLKVGQSVFIDLALDNEKTRNTLLLKKGSFFQDSGGSWVFKLNHDGTEATKQSIKIGKQNTQYYEILQGLEIGDEVIISSYESFRSSRKISLNQHSQFDFLDFFR